MINNTACFISFEKCFKRSFHIDRCSPRKIIKNMKNAQYSCFSIQKSRLLVNGQLFIRKGGFLSKGVFNIGYFKINEILICMSLRSKTFMSKRTMRIRVILENQFYKQMYQTRLKKFALESKSRRGLRGSY